MGVAQSFRQFIDRKDIECDEFIVIEIMQSNDMYSSAHGAWPRARGNDWRETLQTGDIVEAQDRKYNFYESLVRYVYPKNHQTMAGKCIIHFIGLDETKDEILSVDSVRICKRYTHYSKPKRDIEAEKKREKQLIRTQLLSIVNTIQPNLAEKITRMLLALDIAELYVLLNERTKLMNRIDQILKMKNIDLLFFFELLSFDHGN